MGNTLFQSLIPTITLFTTFLTSTPQATLQAQPSSIKQEAVVYVVKPGESLTSIAQKEYGSVDYWTTLWSDNDWIKDANAIEKDSKLQIRSEKPEKPLVAPKKQAVVTPVVVVEEVRSTVMTTETETIQIAQSPASLTEAQITFLGNCESGMTATRNSGNGYYGAFQFSPATWRSMGTAYERADMAPLEVQIDAVQRLLARSSIWTQFPGCAKKMQLAGLI